MKAGIVALFSAMGLAAIFTLPGFTQSNSYNNTETASASGNSNMSSSGEPGPATATGGASTNLWQQTIIDAAHNAEVVTEKAYNKVARNVKDISLVARVMAVLRENKSTRDSDVHVTSDNGVVTITGSAPSEHDAQYVQEVVASVYGVKAVNNGLSYPHSSGFVTSRDADSMGVAHPAYSDKAPAENVPIR